jgi:1-acyl-sn-glycerol-3-phosphate acyltransferase
MKILERAQTDGAPVPVVPMALTNVWGSLFSRVERRNGEQTAMVRPFRRGLFSRVGLNVGAPIAAPLVTPDALRERVAALMV